jgi:hypothetical protein
VLSKIFGPKRVEPTKDWRKLCTEELHDFLYPSPNIIQVIKSKRMRLVQHVASLGEKGNLCVVLVGKQRKETAWKT